MNILLSLTPDEYRIDITPARRGLTAGWRVQVYDLGHDRSGGLPQLTESVWPWRTVGLWRATRQGALHLGISEAYEIHGDSAVTGPLVVWADADAPVVDERPDAAGPADMESLAKRLERTEAARADAYGWWRDACSERDEAREDAEQAEDALARIVYAAKEAEARFDAEEVSAQGAFERLLGVVRYTAGTAR